MLGVVVLALALLLMAKGHRAILDTDSPELVTSGVLAHVRHPLHLGTLLVYLAGILATLSLATLVLWFVIVIGYDRLASYEEQKLEEVFGQVYRDYKKRVPKWIPRP
jgi:protein-S-isoprenylcysteine O-methyltransferase Ste14